MPDLEQNDQKRIDQLLSAFADQIIESDNPASVPLSDEKAVKELQETVLQLNQLTPKPITQASADKIKRNLGLAWNEQYKQKPSLLEKFIELIKVPTRSKGYISTSRRRQMMATRIAAAAIAVVIVTFVVLPGLNISGGSTSGTANGELNPWLIGAGLVLFGAFGLWWWLTSRRN